MSTRVSPMAWSPDGQQVLGTRNNDDEVISFGPDNRQLNDPEKPDDLLVVDPFRGTERVVDVGAFDTHTAAAWSPGGDLVAATGWPDAPARLADRQRLVVVDPAGGGPRWQVDLGDRRILAGPAAWHPDGRRLALLAFDGCAGTECTSEEAAARTWRIEFLDAATGHAVGQALPAGTSVSRVIGWRGDDPVLRYVSGTEQDTDRQAILAALSPGGDREVLVTAPVGSTDLIVPGDLLTRAAFGAGAPAVGVRRPALGLPDAVRAGAARRRPPHPPSTTSPCDRPASVERLSPAGRRRRQPGEAAHQG
ncbi:hypothetical protein NKG94_46765 [Micromonospora sp. M12]